MFHSLFVISTFVVLVDLEDIFSTAKFVLDYFSYRVMVEVISLTQVIYIFRVWSSYCL